MQGSKRAHRRLLLIGTPFPRLPMVSAQPILLGISIAQLILDQHCQVLDRTHILSHRRVATSRSFLIA